MYAKGLRAGAITPPQAQRSGSEAPVVFAGAQGEFGGLDQVNIVVTAAGITSNAVTIVIE